MEFLPLNLNFDPKNSVGVGSTGSHYDIISTGLNTSGNYSIENRFVPEKSIYMPNGHVYTTGQELTYDVGYAGTGLVWTKTSVGATTGIGTVILETGSTVYAVNLGRDRIGLSTVGFPTAADAVYFYNLANNIGFGHSLLTNFPKVTSTIERYYGLITTKTNHNLTSGDVITIDAIPVATETVSLRYDPVLAKITTEKVSFDNNDFSSDLTSNIIKDKFSSNKQIKLFFNNEPGGLGQAIKLGIKELF